ncbi:hypothetical protein [Peribacillus alkalitolerans]|uniref:hypothetical protein n=1 Tax=Peribacillus alkalitolerans TaxID=1550385 RepID=UPI0013D7C8B5|nr:hypothetical protein [Peribacillus alkalitolerans]
MSTEKKGVQRIGFINVFIFLLIMVGTNLILTKPITWTGLDFRWAMFVSNSIGGLIGIIFVWSRISKVKLTPKTLLFRFVISVIIATPISYLIVFEG